MNSKQIKAYEQHQKNASEDISGFTVMQCIERAREQDRLWLIAYG